MACKVRVDERRRRNVARRHAAQVANPPLSTRARLMSAAGRLARMRARARTALENSSAKPRFLGLLTGARGSAPVAPVSGRRPAPRLRRPRACDRAAGLRRAGRGAGRRSAWPTRRLCRRHGPPALSLSSSFPTRLGLSSRSGTAARARVVCVCSDSASTRLSFLPVWRGRTRTRPGPHAWTGGGGGARRGAICALRVARTSTHRGHAVTMVRALAQARRRAPRGSRTRSCSATTRAPGYVVRLCRDPVARPRGADAARATGPG